MQSKFIFVAALLGAFSVVLGAFGAHGLKAKLTPDQLQVFETAVRYQFYHTFAILVCALLMDKYAISPFILYAFLLGIIFFSGSLYLLSCRELLGLTNWKWLGPITPIGGLLFIIGWLWLAFSVLKE